ncbi:hypothetical protein GQ42DRAFT_91210 [Ramicandelaber brevisporus]|nr:hypothetical protein GQ42DRAFT_91210 [Ramicandelaber brevisporus]
MPYTAHQSTFGHGISAGSDVADTQQHQSQQFLHSRRPHLGAMHLGGFPGGFETLGIATGVGGGGGSSGAVEGLDIHDAYRLQNAHLMTPGAGYRQLQQQQQQQQQQSYFSSINNLPTMTPVSGSGNTIIGLSSSGPSLIFPSGLAMDVPGFSIKKGRFGAVSTDIGQDMSAMVACPSDDSLIAITGRSMLKILKMKDLPNELHYLSDRNNTMVNDDNDNNEIENGNASDNNENDREENEDNNDHGDGNGSNDGNDDYDGDDYGDNINYNDNDSENKSPTLLDKVRGFSSEIDNASQIEAETQSVNEMPYPSLPTDEILLSLPPVPCIELATQLSDLDQYSGRFNFQDVAWMNNATSTVQTLAVGTATSEVIIYQFDLDRQPQLQRVRAFTHFDGKITRLEFNPIGNGELLVACSSGAYLIDTRVVQSTITQIIPSTVSVATAGPQFGVYKVKRQFTSGVRDINYNPANPRLFAVGYENDTVEIFDQSLLNKGHILQLKVSGGAGAAGSVLATIHWHPGGRLLAVAGSSGLIEIFDYQAAMIASNTVQINLSSSSTSASSSSKIDRRLLPITSIQHHSSITSMRWRSINSWDLTVFSREATASGGSGGSGGGGGVDSKIYVWDIRRPFVPKHIICEHNSAIGGLLWRNSDELISIGDDHLFVRVDVNKQPLVYENVLPQRAVAVGPTDGMVSSVLNYRREEDEETVEYDHGLLRDDPVPCLLEYDADGISGIPSEHAETQQSNDLDTAQPFALSQYTPSTAMLFVDDGETRRYRNAFKACATGYIFNSANSVSTNCVHNARIAIANGVAHAAVIWETLAYIYSGCVADPNLLRKRPEPITASEKQQEQQLADAIRKMGITQSSKASNPRDHASTRTATGSVATKPTTLGHHPSSAQASKVATKNDQISANVPEVGTGKYSATDITKYKRLINGSLPTFPLWAMVPCDVPLDAHSLKVMRYKSDEHDHWLADILRDCMRLGDVQTLATVVAVLLPVSQRPITALERGWFLQYAAELERQHLYVIVAMLHKILPVESTAKSFAFKYGLACANCQHVFENEEEPTAPAAAPATVTTTTSEPQKHQPQPRIPQADPPKKKPPSGHCPSCDVAFNCSVCELPVAGMYMWCPGCLHGGHIDHMVEWFASNSGVIECPTGCGHDCATMTLPPVTDHIVNLKVKFNVRTDIN